MELHLWSLNSHFLDEYVLDLILDTFIVFCVLPECNSVYTLCLCLMSKEVRGRHQSPGTGIAVNGPFDL